MKNYKKKIGFTFALSLICLPNGFALTGSNDDYSSSSSESSKENFDNRPGFLGDKSRANDPTSFDSRSGANDNTRSNSQMTTTTPTPTPSTGPNVAPRRTQ